MTSAQGSAPPRLGSSLRARRARWLLVTALSSSDKRARAADCVAPMVQTCADKGFDAVEFDNLDSCTRFEDVASIKERMPFGRGEALAFAIAEECGRFAEYDSYTAGYGEHVVVVEYTAEGFRKACEGFGSELSIVRRDGMEDPTIVS